MDKKQTEKKPESGLGEFWDKWIADLEEDEKAVAALREKRKQEGTGYENGDKG